MRGKRIFHVACCIWLAAGGHAFGWSFLDEVMIFDPDLSVEMLWELTDAKTYCESPPANLDLLACRILDPDEFWIGVDAVGNRYGTINSVDPTGTFFDIYRRPVGSSLGVPIVRITKRVEIVIGEPVKLFAAGRWEVDLTNGFLLVHLRGQCLMSNCVAEGDTTEHLGLLRVSGLPPLFEIVNSYEPSGILSFTVPRHPEGLNTGDRYDLYVGDVTSLTDLSQAAPLACDIAAGKQPGNRIRIADPLPDPGPGQARYYLTSVTSGTKRRAGRRTEGGMLVGRDTRLLPSCP